MLGSTSMSVDSILNIVILLHYLIAMYIIVVEF